MLFPAFLKKVDPVSRLWKEIQVLGEDRGLIFYFSPLCFPTMLDIKQESMKNNFKSFFPSDQELSTVFIRYEVISQSLSLEI